MMIMTAGNEGKGKIGCVLTILLMVTLTLIILRLGPSYFAFKSFEGDLKRDISRAGANGWDDETIMKDVLDLSKRNQLGLTRDDIKIERFAGQVQVTVQYAVELDLFVYQHRITLNSQVSSFIGRL
jgi:hypothetical protein